MPRRLAERCTVLGREPDARQGHRQMRVGLDVHASGVDPPDGVEVPPERLMGGTVEGDLPMIEPQRPIAQPTDRAQVVRHEDDRPAGALEVLHPSDAAALELRVADRERLVDDQHVRLEVRCHGERQPQAHAGGVALQRRVEEAFHAGERGDLVEARAHVAAGHAEDRPAEEHVLSSCEFVVEACADVEQRAQPSAHAGHPGRRRRDPREDPQQRGLACAVAADDADQLTTADRERHILQGPEVLALGGTAPAHPVRDDLGQQLRPRGPASPVALAQPGDLDGVAH